MSFRDNFVSFLWINLTVFYLNMKPHQTKAMIFYIINSLLLAQVRSELFTAMVDLQKVLFAEQSIANDLKEYIAKEEARLQTLKT